MENLSYGIVNCMVLFHTSVEERPEGGENADEKLGNVSTDQIFFVKPLEYVPGTMLETDASRPRTIIESKSFDEFSLKTSDRQNEEAKLSPGYE